MTLPATYRGPGLVDLQLNGYAGFDFNAPASDWCTEALTRVRTTMARRGVAVALPTLITDDAGRMIERAATYRSMVEADAALDAAFPYLHIEGPFICPDDGPRGAHPARYCATPAALPDFLSRLIDASGGRIGLMTLAPELPGAPGLVRSAVRQGIRIAIGHTGASADEIAACVDAGAVMSTHLGNGSHQSLPRHENYIQVQLGEDRLHASFIADGHHLPWYALRNFIRAKRTDHSILVTDAIAAADAPPGRYRLGEGEVEVSADLRVSRPGEPNLAGSALTLDRAVVNTVLHCGISFEIAWAMASIHPAALLGLPVPADVEVRVSEAGFATAKD